MFLWNKFVGKLLRVFNLYGINPIERNQLLIYSEQGQLRVSTFLFLTPLLEKAANLIFFFYVFKKNVSYSVLIFCLFTGMIAFFKYSDSFLTIFSVVLACLVKNVTQNLRQKSAFSYTIFYKPLNFFDKIQRYALYWVCFVLHFTIFGMFVKVLNLASLKEFLQFFFYASLFVSILLLLRFILLSIFYNGVVLKKDLLFAVTYVLFFEVFWLLICAFYGMDFFRTNEKNVILTFAAGGSFFQKSAEIFHQGIATHLGVLVAAAGVGIVSSHVSDIAKDSLEKKAEPLVETAVRAATKVYQENLDDKTRQITQLEAEKAQLILVNEQLRASAKSHLAELTEKALNGNQPSTSHVGSSPVADFIKKEIGTSSLSSVDEISHSANAENTESTNVEDLQSTHVETPENNKEE